MVCKVETSQLMLMLLHRPDLEVEKILEMPCNELACSAELALSVDPMHAYWHMSSSSIEGCFGSADNGGRGG